MSITPTIHENALTDDERQTLLDFYMDDENFVRKEYPLMRQKVVHWNDEGWPKDIVKRICDELIPGYTQDLMLFFCTGHGGLGLHTDAYTSGKPGTQYINVSIPLHFEGPANTVFFKNWWRGEKALISRTPPPPSGQASVFVSDYDKFEGLTDEPFDPEVHAKYLNHLKIEDLHGLTFDQIVYWKKNSIFTADSQQIHSGGVGHVGHKHGLTIFAHKDAE
jgi:hypothetical protein